MAGLNIYKESLNEYTLLSNHFIDNYMEDANEAQLQVYLYILRMINANLPFTVEDISNKFKHSEKEVLRALKYWELQKLISLDFDSNKNLTGIHLECMPHAESAPAVQTTPATPVATIVPATPVIQAVTPAPIASVTALPQSIQNSPADTPTYIKPAYTADQLRNFKAQEGSAQLLFVAETYVGKPLTPNDIKTIYFMQDVLHFSEDLIDYLIQYCVERGKKDFRYMEKVAVNWAEEGVTTPGQAQTISSRYDRNVYNIMNALGRSGNPTNKELEFINRWLKEYGFSADVVIEACERSALAVDKNRFEYAEGILSRWKQENVHQKADIITLDSQHSKLRKNTGKVAANNRFNQFSQTNYSNDILESELLSN